MKKRLIPAIGAIMMMALRFYGESDFISALLVLGGVTALLYGLRHASNKRDYFFIAILFILTYEVRFYDYTESHLYDVVLGLGIGLVMFSVMAFERLFAKDENKITYVLIYPLVYTLFMCFTEVTKINMPFRLDPYLSSFTLLSQIGALSGIYMLDFILALTASVIVFVADHPNNIKTKKLSVIYAIFMFLILGFGLIHLNKMNTEENGKKDSVRIICAGGPNSDVYSAGQDFLSLEESVEILEETVEKANREKGEILLFSEEAYGVRDADEEKFLTEAKALAKENNIHILLAYEVSDSDGDNAGKGFNKLCFITDQGEIIYDYTKYCLVPFIETADYVKGEKGIESFEIAVHGKTLKIACAICYDTDFDFYMSSMDKDSDLLLVPTWDWKVVAGEHFGVSRLRAIANETTLVRSTYDGYSAVIDSSGKILFKDSTVFNSYKYLLVYDVPVR